MRPGRSSIVVLCLLTGIMGGGMLSLSCGRPSAPQAVLTAPRPPRLRPDYTGLVIPPNVAPLNFLIEEPGTAYHARISGTRGSAIDIRSGKPCIEFPEKEWKALLESNKNGRLELDLSVRGGDGRWTRFATVTNTVAEAEIDPWLAYRRTRPLHNIFVNISIWQRNLEGFDESLILSNASLSHGCINCHTFLNKQADTMLLHTRGSPGRNMVVVQKGAARRIDTRTKFNPSPAAYSSWHPGGRFIACSVNRLSQFFHAAGENRDVFDANSDLILYWLDSHTVQSVPAIAKPDRLETFPEWSPDGRYLYFSSCPSPNDPNVDYRTIRYDLMRVGYDPESNQWGTAETMISAADTGLSALEPRVSPDGRFLLVTLCQYGSFPPYQPGADLYMMDLQSRQLRRLDINSNQCDSWHSWSSNGRWIVFSTKRDNGVFARPYFSYVDAAGRAHKPFVLPQRDPQRYDSCMDTFSVPEFVKEPVSLRGEDFAREIGARPVVQSALDLTAAGPPPAPPPDRERFGTSGVQ